MLVAVVPETDARRDRDLGLGEQQLGELQRTEMAIGLGNLPPDEHGRLGSIDNPAGAGKAVTKHIPA